MTSTPSRRSVLKWAGIGTATVVVPAGAFATWAWSSADHTNIGRVRFEQPLAIPPLADATRDDLGRTTFALEIGEGEAELLPGKVTPTWGVNGPYLGPTIRVRRGETVSMQVRNGLPEATTLHWHGMELPATADGGPHQPIAPGETWSPSWTVDQPAASLWYHPHPHGASKEHVYRGVAGMLLVDDGVVTGLPGTYGVDDIPLVIQDKQFHDNGDLDFDGIAFGGLDVIGLLGSEILVNGTWGPYFDVTTGRVRLRILNASNARVYALRFEDDRPFHVIGSDAGLLPAPIATSRVQVSPGERVELVVAFAPGERVILRSDPPDLGANFVYDRLAGGDDAFEILEFRAMADLAPSPPLPERLAGDVDIPARSVERTFTLGDFTINGRTVDMGRIDFVVPLGTSETWVIRNEQDIPHNFHVHNAAFRVLGDDGKAPHMAGRKDTVFVAPHTSVTLAIEFGQWADSGTPYMAHCHVLAHEDAGMMMQFVLVEPGTEHNVLPRLEPDGHDHG